MKTNNFTTIMEKYDIKWEIVMIMIAIIIVIIVIVIPIVISRINNPRENEQLKNEKEFPMGAMVIIKISGQRGQVVGYKYGYDEGGRNKIRVRYRCDYVEETHDLFITTKSQRPGFSYKIDNFEDFELEPLKDIKNKISLIPTSLKD